MAEAEDRNVGLRVFVDVMAEGHAGFVGHRPYIACSLRPLVERSPQVEAWQSWGTLRRAASDAYCAGAVTSGGFMRISLSLIISTATLIIGLIAGKPDLWLPVSVMAASLVTTYSRRWVASNELGEWRLFSLWLKFFLALVGLYAIIGQFGCFYLLVRWSL